MRRRRHAPPGFPGRGCRDVVRAPRWYRPAPSGLNGAAHRAGARRPAAAVDPGDLWRATGPAKRAGPGAAPVSSGALPPGTRPATWPALHRHPERRHTGTRQPPLDTSGHLFDYVNRQKNYKADRRSAAKLSLNQSRGAPLPSGPSARTAPSGPPPPAVGAPPAAASTSPFPSTCPPITRSAPVMASGSATPASPSSTSPPAPRSSPPSSGPAGSCAAARPRNCCSPTRPRPGRSLPGHPHQQPSRITGGTGCSPCRPPTTATAPRPATTLTRTRRSIPTPSPSPRQRSTLATHARSSKIHWRTLRDLPARASPDPSPVRHPKFLTPGQGADAEEDHLSQDNL
jgi:hypothetical protein